MPMNYYNPYFQMLPSVAPTAKTGLFRGLLSGARGINWGTILNNTQRTLGIINQAIPVVKQVSPVMKNARTMFQVMNEFKKMDSPSASSSTSEQPNNIQSAETQQAKVIQKEENQPTFFL